MFRLHLNADGLATVTDDDGLYVGWTEHSHALGWSASWRKDSAEQREFTLSASAAADALRAAFREELS